MEFYIERLDKKGEPPVLLAGTTSLGRHSRNTLAFSADDRCVSGYHAVIYATSGQLLLQDMQSTNGTYVNGRKVQDEQAIKEGDEIGLGMSGPRFRVVRSASNTGLNSRIIKVVDDVAPKRSNANIPHPVNPANDDPPVTPTIAMKTSAAPKYKYIIVAAIAVIMLTAVIMMVSFTSGGDTGKTKPSSPSSPRFTFTHGEILSGGIDDEQDGNIGRSSVHTDRSVVETRIDAILQRFGERDYQIPAEMIERIEFYLNQYTGSRRRTIATFMERRKQYFPMIRRVFTEKNIPLDLAYVSIVESGLNPTALSHAGAKGLWQFMPKTGRAYGLEVSAHLDERTDPEKSTYAAAGYFKDLIAIFGSKSSVMLCMAAYNAGEYRVINALKRIDDPVNNRDFWYLYKRKWLPEETREYIPQILALIIISEHMEEYGFE